jgi:hypothetical protein
VFALAIPYRGDDDDDFTPDATRKAGQPHHHDDEMTPVATKKAG